MAAATAVFEELKEPQKGHIGIDGFMTLADRLGRARGGLSRWAGASLT